MGCVTSTNVSIETKMIFQTDTINNVYMTFALPCDILIAFREMDTEITDVEIIKNSIDGQYGGKGTIYCVFNKGWYILAYVEILSLIIKNNKIERTCKIYNKGYSYPYIKHEEHTYKTEFSMINHNTCEVNITEKLSINKGIYYRHKFKKKYKKKMNILYLTFQSFIDESAHILKMPTYKFLF